MSLWDAFENYNSARQDLRNEFLKLIVETIKILIDYKWVRILVAILIAAIILWNYASQPPEINLYDAVMSDIKAELGVSPEKIVWTDVIYPFNSDSYKEFKEITEKNGKTPQAVEEMFSKNLRLLTVQPLEEANFWFKNKQNVTIIGMYGEKEIKIMIRYAGDVDIKYQGNYRSEIKSYKMK
ncbi:MAG: hypothetical protein IJO47_03795 [Clostridia bacterium]|nr:hypothetical protein [Clostridia bacterium]